MFPCLEKIVSLINLTFLASITPLWVDFILFSILPTGFIWADIPLLDDLYKFLPSSIALNIEWEKCCSGPMLEPNQTSYEIFNMWSKSLDCIFKLPE